MSAFADLRADMVRQLCERGVLRDARIADAFRAVPRHLFLPDVSPREAYSDRSIAVKMHDGVPISSSSQPAMMAEMLGQLDVREGQRVLEIGTGTGYNAALLATLLGPRGFIATIDLDDDLVDAARAHLHAAGFPHVRTLCADGTLGDADDAPFDAIIATVAVADVPTAWFDQLRVGGRLVMPLALRSMQKVVCFERTAKALASTSIVDGGFMMLRGSTPSVAAEAVALGETTSLRTSDRAGIDARALDDALEGPWIEVEPACRIAVDEIWSSFGLWLALHDDAFCAVTSSGTPARAARVPDITGTARSPHDGQATTLGLASGDALVVFAPHKHGTIALRAFGDAANLVDRLQATIGAWHDAGRPGNDVLRIDVVPHRELVDAREVVDARVTRSGANDVRVDLPSARAFVRWIER